MPHELPANRAPAARAGSLTLSPGRGKLAPTLSGRTEERHTSRAALSRAVVPAVAVAAIGATVMSAGATAPGLNGRIGFERPDRTDADLFSIEADGSAQARLTKTRGVSGEISYSPDGSKISFTRTRGRNKPFEIYSANADGSGVRRLTRHKAFSIGSSWSPTARGSSTPPTRTARRPNPTKAPFPRSSST